MREASPGSAILLTSANAAREPQTEAHDRTGRRRPMNIALWLERAGESHPGLPAVALGPRMMLDYRGLALRAARLAGALRGRLRLEPGDRVAIVAKNCVEYVEAMFGVWHAGLAAVPANAKLHGAELGYIIGHSGARACLASPGLDAEIAPFAP